MLYNKLYNIIKEKKQPHYIVALEFLGFFTWLENTFYKIYNSLVFLIFENSMDSKKLLV